MTLGRLCPAGASMYEEGTTTIRCRRGHEFEVPGFSELGYHGPIEPLTPCPICRQLRRNENSKANPQGRTL